MKLYPKLPSCNRAELFHKASIASECLGVAYETADFLYGLVRLTKPGVVVETGTHVGDSAEAIGEALKANGFGHLYTCDTNLEMTERARVRLNGLPVTVVCCTGTELIYQRAARTTMDFVFIDSGSPAVRLEEVKLLGSENISPLGIVAMHDACISYENLYEEFEKRNWPHLVFPDNVGISVFQRPE
jgi:predicted O-methyltransferase YrrM